MIVDIFRDRKEWLSEFNKKFANFCKNAPIVIGFDSKSERYLYVAVYLGEKKKTLDMQFDFDTPPSDFIAEIKQRLIGFYPRFSVELTRFEDLSSSEIQSKILEGYSLEDAVQMQNEVKTTFRYRVDKIFHDHNTLQLENIDTSESFRCVSRKPLSILMDEIPQTPVSYEWFTQNLTVIEGDKK